MLLITTVGICSDANNSSCNQSKKKPADGNDSNGPTVILGYTAASQDNPFASFMYFVPLVSPDTIDVEVSTDNKQKVTTISYERTISSKSFCVSCEFKMFGSGFTNTYSTPLKL